MNTLLSKIRTTAERDQVNSELDLLITNLYEHGGSSLDSVLRTQIRSWVAEIIRKGMPEGNDIEKAESYLKSLKDSLTKLKVLNLTIAFEPTDSSIDKFSDFVNKNRSNASGPDGSQARRVILDFEIDPKIYGGAEITYDGNYRDFSLKRLFEEEYKAQEGELMSIIKHTDKTDH